MRKKSKSPLKMLEDELWQECRRIANDIYTDHDGIANCYTCPAKDIQGKNKQLGHGPWPKSVLSAFLKYDMRCLRWQCYSCNINKGGMGTEFYKRMLKEEGKKFIAELELDRQKSVKAHDFYLELLEKYKKT